MEISFVLAQFWGWFILLSCLPLVLKRKTLEDFLGMAEDKIFNVLSGYFVLVLGLVTVILHNIWAADWRMAVTLLGWLMILRGVIRIGCPETMRKFVAAFKEKLLLCQVILALFVILGCWLIWVSY